MFEPKVTHASFPWPPPEHKKTGFERLLNPRKSERKTPALWLAHKGGDLFLVNASDESLASVSSTVVGFISSDEVTCAIEPKTLVTYSDVRPGDAIKVEEYDDFYDLDYLLGISLTIETDSLGLIEIQSPMSKGGIHEAVLLWLDGSIGKNVFIRTIRHSA